VDERERKAARQLSEPGQGIRSMTSRTKSIRKWTLANLRNSTSRNCKEKNLILTFGEWIWCPTVLIIISLFIVFKSATMIFFIDSGYFLSVVAYSSKKLLLAQPCLKLRLAAENPRHQFHGIA